VEQAFEELELSNHRFANSANGSVAGHKHNNLARHQQLPTAWRAPLSAKLRPFQSARFKFIDQSPPRYPDPLEYCQMSCAS
jgi:hypothetical protein